MRVVLDANVWLAGFVFPGVCRAIVDLCLDSEGHDLFCSDPIADEVRRHLVGKFNHAPQQAADRLTLMRDAAAWVSPAHVDATVCRDPDDLPVLGTAGAADADCLVTGDADMLVLGTFHEVSILSPRAFWKAQRA